MPFTVEFSRRGDPPVQNSSLNTAPRGGLPPVTIRLLPYLADRESYAKFRPMSSSLQYLTDEAGEKTAVIVPIADYTRFMEDMEDLAAIAERRKEPCINHQDFVDELKRDGLFHDNLA